MVVRTRRNSGRAGDPRQGGRQLFMRHSQFSFDLSHSTCRESSRSSNNGLSQIGAPPYERS